MRRILSSALTAASLLGAFALGAASGPAEDSPTFDCRVHGNHTCGVILDPLPNNGVKNTVRVNIVFSPNGKAVDAYPFGYRR